MAVETNTATWRRVSGDTIKGVAVAYAVDRAERQQAHCVTSRKARLLPSIDPFIHAQVRKGTRDQLILRDDAVVIGNRLPTMQVETGMPVLSAFLLVAGASTAFVLGGVMVFSTVLLSLAQPLPLVVVFSTSSFIFICTALMEMLRHSQQGFSEYVSEYGWSDVVSTGLGQLFAVATLTFGIVSLYAADTVIYRVTVMAAECYGDASMPMRRHAGAQGPRGSFSQLDLAASAYSIEMPSDRSTRRGVSRFHVAELPEISTTASPYEPYEMGVSRVQVCGTVLSAVAVIIHHIPEGLALYVSAVRHFHIGVAVALAVMLHSLPDGIALASSIYFASGHRTRGVLWCLLSPVGKLIGATGAWMLIEQGNHEALSHTIFTGFATGILLGLGVKEVMPTTHNYAVGKAHGTVIGTIVGMLVITASKFVS